MKLSAMDSNSVTIISLSLASHAFKRYRCDRTLKLGVKVESLKKIMDTASSDDSLILTADDSLGEADEMTISLEADMSMSVGAGEKRKKVKWTRVSTFELGLVNVEQDSRVVPDNRAEAVTIEMSADEFRRIVSELKTVADTLRIQVYSDNSGVRFHAQGEESSGSFMMREGPATDKAKKADEDDSVIITNGLSGSLAQAFAMKYMLAFASASPLCERVKLRLADETPLSVECTPPAPLPPPDLRKREVQLSLTPRPQTRSTPARVMTPAS